MLRTVSFKLSTVFKSAAEGVLQRQRRGREQTTATQVRQDRATEHGTDTQQHVRLPACLKLHIDILLKWVSNVISREENIVVFKEPPASDSKTQEFRRKAARKLAARPHIRNMCPRV